MRAVVCISILAFWTVMAAAQGVESGVLEDLQAMLDERGDDLTLDPQCTGDFTGGGRTQFAVAGTASDGRSGAYFVYAAGLLIELAEFEGAAELQCLDATEAGRMNSAIQQSEGIVGTVPDSYPGHIICGFVETTEARCWAYENGAGTFVKVGWWMT